ncbi:MAG: T9SS type A sorting domain-containing protein, partial [bacterium]
QDAEFDLSNYARRNVQIRWAFASDPGLATPDDERLIGFLVDNIQIRAGDQVIWENDAEEEGDVEFATGPVSGDYWERSQANRRSGQFSAHCPIRVNLQNALISPPIDIPERGWYVWFDFWVLADTRMPDSDNDNLLDDYFRVEVSTDQVSWEMIIYDYGRDANWQSNWHFYGPDTTFRADFPEWKRKLNLTGFAGQRIWLRWVVRTDDVMNEPQGTGVWIDDVRINMTDRRTNDVGLYYLRVNYPTAKAFNARGVLAIRNFGMASQQRVAKYYRVENGPYNPIVPWDGIDPDSIKLYPFTVDSRRIPAADTLTIWGITQLVGDENRDNDSIAVRNILYYPQGIWVLGYDNRTFRYRYNLNRGHGPAIYFTPNELRLGVNFDIKALRVWWNGEQGDNVQTRLHIFADGGGRPGDEIHNQMVTVNRADVIPNIHVIDLSNVEALRNLQSNFWVWFEILRDDHWPQIIGDDQKFGQGHYFDYDGQNLREINADWMVHAVLMPTGATGRELVPGRDTLDFEAVAPGNTKEMRVALFNGATQPVTIRGVSLQDGEGFQLDPAFVTPATLRIGDVVHLYVTFQPAEERNFTGVITFQTDDQTPPQVVLRGRGDRAAGISEEFSPPVDFRMGNPYPNPFNSQTIIPFSLERSGAVQVRIYDLKGSLIKGLAEGFYPAGQHQLVVDGTGLPAGVYVVKMRVGKVSRAVKVAVVK